MPSLSAEDVLQLVKLAGQFEDRRSLMPDRLGLMSCWLPSARQILLLSLLFLLGIFIMTRVAKWFAADPDLRMNPRLVKARTMQLTGIGWSGWGTLHCCPLSHKTTHVDTHNYPS